MGPIINWFVKHVLTAIEEHLDPTLKARWDAILARGRALDDAHTELNRKELDLQARFVESEKRQTELQGEVDAADRAIAEDETKLAASDARRKEIADDLAKTKTDISNQSDHDAVRGDV